MTKRLKCVLNTGALPDSRVGTSSDRSASESASRIGEARARSVLALAKDAKDKIVGGNSEWPQPTAADYQRDYLPFEKLKIENL